MHLTNDKYLYLNYKKKLPFETTSFLFGKPLFFNACCKISFCSALKVVVLVESAVLFTTDSKDANCDITLSTVARISASDEIGLASEDFALNS